MTSLTTRLRRGRPGGFSLLELLIVLVIFAFLVSIAMPAFHRVRLGFALSAAQRDVATALSRGRWLAINNGSSRTVDLTSATEVRVTQSGNTVAGAALAAYSVTQTHTGSNTFTFDSRGLIPSGTATPITITLTSSMGAQKTVIVDRLGKIQTP